MSSLLVTRWYRFNTKEQAEKFILQMDSYCKSCSEPRHSKDEGQWVVEATFRRDEAFMMVDVMIMVASAVKP